MNDDMVLIVLIIAVLIYSLKKLSLSKDPKEELLKVKDLYEKEVINENEYNKLKTRLMKRIE